MTNPDLSRALTVHGVGLTRRVEAREDAEESVRSSSTSSLCRTCSHWQHLEEGWGVCHKIRRSLDGSTVPPDEGTLATISEDVAIIPRDLVQASLITAHLFGCVHHERGGLW